MAKSDVLVIGAGPFGLSISAHLRHRGIEHTVVGRPMNTWRAHMPPGLFLKSEPYGSKLSAPTRGYDLRTYAQRHGFDDYVERIGPLSLERFLGYADWFAGELVPGIRDLTVTRVSPGDGGFTVEFAEDSPVLAQQVIIATGLLPYAVIPRELAGLPAGLMTHSSAHGRTEQFRGKRVAVIGGGQSALQTAALLHEDGTDVRVVTRRPEIAWHTPIPEKLTPARRLLHPPNTLCEGWACVIYNSPDAFRLLPRHLRVHRAASSFGPSGAWWLRDRVEGAFDVLTSHQLLSAEPQGSGVRLRLDGPRQSVIDADHVIAGTGFRVDLSRLTFLAPEIQAGLTLRGACPQVNRAGESSLPGLYFAGAHTMTSLGPGTRFISGTHHTAARLARSVARRAGQAMSWAERAEPAALAAQ